MTEVPYDILFEILLIFLFDSFFGLFDNSTKSFPIASVASFDCSCNRDFGSVNKTNAYYT